MVDVSDFSTLYVRSLCLRVEVVWALKALVGSILL